MWTFDVEPPVAGGRTGSLTVVEGTSFCLSDLDGTIWPDTPTGLFVADTRFLSRLELLVDGHRPELLSASTGPPAAATIVARIPPLREPDVELVAIRRRVVGDALREDLVLRNYGHRGRRAAIELVVDADFADLFDVKAGRSSAATEIRAEAGPEGIRFAAGDRAVRIDAGRPPRCRPGRLSWEAEVPAGGEWSVCVQASVELDGRPLPTPYPCGEPVDTSATMTRQARWERAAPRLDTDHAPLARAFSRAVSDLGSLRIFDPEDPGRAVIAAGAPWFMALFGRDALLTAWMALPVSQELAFGVLETLARFQGEEVHDDTEEQPGRILHEVRFGRSRSMHLGDGHIYYGTADATPLFVMLLGEVHRWGGDPDRVAALLPHADRALAWARRDGDPDGDGLIEYRRRTPAGLRNQGWKDSWDGITFADGMPAEPPIALVEVQAYHFAALQARARLAEAFGDDATATRCTEQAERLRDEFERRFWLDDRGWYALGLDRDERAIDSLTSNLGHVLWSGIADEERAAAVAAHLVSDELFSGWGIRTLATSMGAFDPLSYHNGSVWPHDTAIAVAGLARYGFHNAARRVGLALLDAADEHGGRLPELFSGLGRDDVRHPVGYPTSCSPQAWAAAAPLLVLRSLLGLDPDLVAGHVAVAPVLPDDIEEIELLGMPLGDTTVDLRIAYERVTLRGLPAGVTLSLPTRR